MTNNFVDFFKNVKSHDDLKEMAEKAGLIEKTNTKPDRQEQEDWEYFIGLFLQSKFKELKRPDIKQGAPDFVLPRLPGCKVWFECVAGSGYENTDEYKYGINEVQKCKLDEGFTDKNRDDLQKYLCNVLDNWQKQKMNKMWHIQIYNNLPSAQMCPYQRNYYNIVYSKEKKCKEKIKKGIIGKEDINILCVNGCIPEDKGFLNDANDRICLEPIYYAEKRIYNEEICSGITPLAKMCSILFGLVQGSKAFNWREMIPYPQYLNKNDYLANKKPKILLKNDNGYYDGNLQPIKITDKEVEDNYLKCDAFCREDFPFNGILFSTISVKNLKKGKNNRLYYLHNPNKPPFHFMNNLFKDLGIICIHCGLFYRKEEIYIDERIK